MKSLHLEDVAGGSGQPRIHRDTVLIIPREQRRYCQNPCVLQVPRDIAPGMRADKITKMSALTQLGVGAT